MSTPWNTRRGIAGTKVMIEVGVEHGLDPGRCLAGSRIEPSDLDDPRTEIDAIQELTVARNLLTGVGRHEWARLGAEAGRRHTFGTAGVVGFAMLTSATVGQAAAVAVRYCRLGPWLLSVHVDETVDPVRIRCDDDKAPEDLRGFLRERDLAITASLLSVLLGATHLYRMDPVDRAIIMPRAMLDRPLLFADDIAAGACLQQCRELLDRRSRPDSVTEEVRGRIRSHQGGPPSMTALAAELHLDPRTLRRRLRREGTSYRALLAEIREDLAVTLLADEGLTVAETARRLGYADTAGFTHAFTRWRGRPPGTYRTAKEP